MPPTEPKPPKLRPPSLQILLRVLLTIKSLEMLNRGHIIRQLVRAVLRVLGELESDVPRYGAGAGLEVAGDEVEECGLSGAVLADYGYAGVHAMVELEGR